MPFENLPETKIKENFHLPLNSYFDPIEGAPCYEFGLKKGMYTDDTQSARACTIGIAKHRHLTLSIIADALYGWLFRNSLKQEPRYPGITTREAMIRYHKHGDPNKCGVDSATCGAAIRIAPVALWFCVRRPRDIDSEIRKVACITHTANSAQDGAVIVAHLIQHSVKGGAIGFSDLYSRCTSKLMFKALQGVHRALESNTSCDEVAQELGGGTKAHAVIPMAIYHLFKCQFRFNDSLRNALNTFHPSGLDMDSILSVCGAIAGAHFAEEVEQSEWIEGLEDCKKIAREAQDLFKIATDSLEA
jgi:ADP-ribosylglycohydrolase